MASVSSLDRIASNGSGLYPDLVGRLAADIRDGARVNLDNLPIADQPSEDGDDANPAPSTRAIATSVPVEQHHTPGRYEVSQPLSPVLAERLEQPLVRTSATSSSTGGYPIRARSVHARRRQLRHRHRGAIRRSAVRSEVPHWTRVDPHGYRPDQGLRLHGVRGEPERLHARLPSYSVVGQRKARCATRTRRCRSRLGDRRRLGGDRQAQGAAQRMQWRRTGIAPPGDSSSEHDEPRDSVFFGAIEPPAGSRAIRHRAMELMHGISRSITEDRVDVS